MKRDGRFSALVARCGKCESPLKISIELIEYLIQCEQDMDIEFDEQIIQITRGNGKSKIIPPTAPMPISLDFEDNGISFLGFCTKCEKVRMAGITVDDLVRLLSENDKEDEI